MERTERAFLGTDLVGSTRLWNRHREAAAALITHLDAVIDSSVVSHGGSVFKSLGDGHLAAFREVSSAAEAATMIRDQAARLTIAGEPVLLRLVLHGGEVEATDSDFFGPPLNLLGRLLKASHGSQILATQWVVERSLAADSQPLGAFLVSGFDAPVSLWEVAPRGASVPPKLTGVQEVLRSVPPERTPLVGRLREIEQIRADLRERSLTTLVGPGGVGKTRLALHVAHRSLGSFAKGIWMVPLVQATSEEELFADLERVTGCRLGAQRDGFAPLADKVNGEPSLLLLDNAEHLLDPVRRLVRRLNQQVPTLRVLVTSREALALPEEAVVPIGPLAPSGSDSRELYASRVREFRPGWEPTEEEADLIRQICSRLDGVPYAIELAAARMRTLGLAALAESLEGGLGVVGAGFREDREHRESLGDVVRWSIDLLAEEERSGLLSLGVAEPGFDLAAARAIIGSSSLSAGELVDSLVSKSLLAFDEATLTYSMLHITRNEVLNLLRESGREEEARLRHLHEYLGRVVPKRDDLRGPEQAATLLRWDQERSNILAALDFGARIPAQQAEVLQAASVFWRYWSMRGHLREGVHRLTGILGRVVGHGHGQAHGQALRGLAWLYYLKGQVRGAEEAVRAALPLAIVSGDVTDRAACCSLLGSTLAWRGLFHEAMEQYWQAFAGFEAVGDAANLARTYLHLGDAAHGAGDVVTARQNVEAARASFIALRDELAVAWALHSLGRCAESEGRWEEAEFHYTESRRIREERRDLRGVAYTRQALCAVTRRPDREAVDLGLEAMRAFKDIGDDGGMVAAALSLARRLEPHAPDLSAGFAWFAKRKAATIEQAFAKPDQAHLDRLTTGEPPADSLELLMDRTANWSPTA